MTENKTINPNYYRNPHGVQIIEIIRDMPFSLGNAVKYVYRCRTKENRSQDLKKALWYIEDHKNNSTQLAVENFPQYTACDEKILDHLLEASDSFENSVIREIYHDWVNSGDFEQAILLLNVELNNTQD